MVTPRDAGLWAVKTGLKLRHNNPDSSATSGHSPERSTTASEGTAGASAAAFSPSIANDSAIGTRTSSSNQVVTCAHDPHSPLVRSSALSCSATYSAMDFWMRAITANA
jgi:hypothetical protein